MLILYIAGGVLLGLILFTRILGAAAGPTDDELVHDAVKRSLERD